MHPTVQPNRDHRESCRIVKRFAPKSCLRSWRRGPVALIAAPLVCGIATTAASAERLENRVAIFAALDKVTAHISKLEVPLGQTVEFGALKITPRVCYSRPETERPKTTSFVEVTELELDGSEKQLFTGWMFAESPGLNAVEHPVFDVWLTECKDPVGGVQASAASPSAEGDAGQAGEPPALAPPRRRVRR